MRDLSTGHILVVDDTEANVDILMETLGDDYDVSVAMDGESALEYLEENLPDLILLDIMMPGLDGYEVIERLKADERTRDIPVIFCTAMVQTEDETKGLKLGAVDYIRKPFSPPIVKARVRNHLRLKLIQEDLAEQNEILRENARLREEVERITKHDLKSPLSAVINVPKLLMLEGNLTENQADMLLLMEKSGYRMLDIINNCLNMYKMETGQYTPQLVPVDLLKVIREIGAEFREIMKFKAMTMDIRLNGRAAGEEDEFYAAGEELLCYSMLANLIKNAVEASPDNEAVTVTLDNSAGPRVSIHNRGAIPQEIRDRFFDKYTTGGKEGGTGLGTYSANLIATTLGGKLELGPPEMDGATLFVHLGEFVEEEPMRDDSGKPPEAGTPDRPEMVPAPPPALTKRSKVLVADDYPSMRQTIIGILKQMGFTSFLEAKDGQAAWELLENNPVGLVISDWNMPRMSGIELLRQVRSSPERSRTPFIIVSGEAQLDSVIEATREQNGEYLCKPFSTDVLMAKVGAYLG